MISWRLMGQPCVRPPVASANPTIRKAFKNGPSVAIWLQENTDTLTPARIFLGGSICPSGSRNVSCFSYYGHRWFQSRQLGPDMPMASDSQLNWSHQTWPHQTWPHQDR